MGMTTTTINQFIQDLRENVEGKVYGSADESFGSLVKVWNGAISSKPSALVRCESVSDIQEVVLLASHYGIPVSVLGGGHDWAGRAFCEGGVVIDLRSLRDVRHDPANEIVESQGGATIGDLLAGLPDDTVIVTGTAKQVGLAGFTMGGGYGPLNGQFGLALDNLVEATVVLADGSSVTANESDHADLFWAIRGGGGNFGVLASLKTRTHRLSEVQAAFILFPISEAKTALGRYQEILDNAPDELGLMTGFLTGQDGKPMLFIASHWSGDKTQGDALLGQITSLKGAITVSQGSSRYADSMGIFDPLVVNGRHHYIETRNLDRFNVESIAALVDGAEQMSSPFSGIVIHDFHGKATRVSPDAAAFPLRKPHLLVEIVSAWDKSSEELDAKHRNWATALSQNLAPHSLSGGYVNLLTDQTRVEQFYGETATRLREVKRHYDPNNMFRSAPGSIYRSE
jgi:FAD/FMN-containing dehydrogenase